jgi:hypothetical protein
MGVTRTRLVWEIIAVVVFAFAGGVAGVKYESHQNQQQTGGRHCSAVAVETQIAQLLQTGRVPTTPCF